MQQSDSSLLSQLKALEVELHQPVARGDAARLDSLLHDDFHEFGRSGSSYAKPDIVASLLAAAQHVRMVADNFLVRRLAADVALLTYRSAHALPDGTLHRDERSLRPVRFAALSRRAGRCRTNLNGSSRPRLNFVTVRSRQARSTTRISQTSTRRAVPVKDVRQGSALSDTIAEEPQGQTASLRRPRAPARARPRCAPARPGCSRPPGSSRCGLASACAPRRAGAP